MAGKNELRITLLGVDQASGPLRSVQQQVSRTTSSLNGATSSMKSYTQGAGLANTATQKWVRGALQQAGYQIGDLAVQLANGTNKMQAFGQQAPQLLQVLGPVGSVMGAAVAVFAAFVVIAEKAKGNVTNLSAAMKDLLGISKGLTSQIDMLRFGVDTEQEVIALKEIARLQTEMAKKRSQYIAADSLSTRQRLAEEIRELQGQIAPYKNIVSEIDNKRLALQRIKENEDSAAEASRVQNLYKLQLIDKEQERLQEGIRILSEHLSKYLQIGDVIKKASEVDLNKVFSDAISPSSALYQFVKKTYDTMQKMTDAVSAAQRTGYYKLETLNKGMMGRAGGKNQGQKIDYSLPEKEKDKKGAAKEDPLKTLRDQIALETEMLGKTEDQQRVIQALGVDWKKYGAETISGLIGQISKMEEVNRVAELQKQIASSISSSMEGAFMSIVDGTSNAKDAFKKMASSIISELYRVLVVQRMVSGIMNFLGFGATGATGVASAVIGAKATGGSVAGNKPYIVGERGPELMIPGRSGTVVPNNKISGDGGVTIIQNNSFGAGVSRAEIQAMMPKIVETTKAAVLDARKRGGSYGSAFA